MAILPTYPEPHSAVPGADYTLREQIPHGDLNQIVANQKSLWDALLRVTNLTIEEKQLGNGTDRVQDSLAVQTPTAFVDVAHGSTVTAALEVGDIITGVAGPYQIINNGVSGSAQIEVAIYRNALVTPVFDGVAAVLSIEHGFNDSITFPFYWVITAAGSANIQIRGKAVDNTLNITAMDDGLYHGTYRIIRPT